MTDLLQKRRDMLADEVLKALARVKATTEEIEYALGMILHDIEASPHGFRVKFLERITDELSPISAVIVEAHLPPITSIMGIHSIDNPEGNFRAKCKCGCGKSFYWNGHVWVEK